MNNFNLNMQVLFKQPLTGKESEGIKLTYDSGVDIKRDLYRNTILSCGTTTSPGIDGHLTKKMTSITTSKYKSKNTGALERKYCVLKS